MKKSTYKKLERIAAEKLGIETLETHISDGLDFYEVVYEVAVWSLKEALKAAYELGKSEK